MCPVVGRCSFCPPPQSVGNPAYLRALQGGFREGRWGGRSRRGFGGRGAPGASDGGGPRAVIWGGGGGPVRLFGVLRGGGQAWLTSPCPPSNHTITISLTLIFAASWFGHASRVDWAGQHSPNLFHGCFCQIVALHFGPQQSQ